MHRRPWWSTGTPRRGRGRKTERRIVADITRKLRTFRPQLTGRRVLCRRRSLRSMLRRGWNWAWRVLVRLRLAVLRFRDITTTRLVISIKRVTRFLRLSSKKAPVLRCSPGKRVGLRISESWLFVQENTFPVCFYLFFPKQDFGKSLSKVWESLLIFYLNNLDYSNQKMLQSVQRNS